MASLNFPGVSIQVSFSEATPLGVCNDHLYLGVSEFSQISNADLRQRIRDRVVSWKDFVKARQESKPRKRTAQERQALRTQLQREIELLDSEQD